MKKNKILFVLLLLISITVVSMGSTFFYVKLNKTEVNDDEILVMTSCNPIYIATLNVVDGVDGYRVQNLSQPTTGCLHDYTLTTEDMKNLSKADVLVVNGGGMEGYLDDVIAAYPDLTIIDTYEYVEHSEDYEHYLIEEEEEESLHLEGKGEHEVVDEVSEEHHHDHGANSHIWMDYRIFEQQAIAIADGLASRDDANGYLFKDNADKYASLINEKLSYKGMQDMLAGSSVAILHEAFAYTAQSFGANVVATMDLDEERQVSAGEVSEFIDEIKEHDVKIVFAEYDYGKSMGDLIEEQTDAKVVYLETLVHGEYGADDYAYIMDDNFSKIKEAL